MNSKIKVALLFGGQSAEHEVSLMSAQSVAQAINQEKFELILIGIDRSGQWYLSENARELIDAPSIRDLYLSNFGPKVRLVPSDQGARLLTINQPQTIDRHRIDVVFPVLHGPFGEDGTVQGLLKLAGIPFVGSSVLGSAVGMDKDVMKRLLRENQIPVGDFLVLHNHQIPPPFEEVTEKIGVPFFVKPANMGSSVGVKKVHNESEYFLAIKEAFRFDRKILLETYIKGREIECSVLGNHQPRASLPGEVLPQHEFYSYEAKYLDENGARLKIPADLPAPKIKEIQDLSLKTFQTLCCEGLGRIDLFLTSEGQLYVNEINTLPGFTKISMYPKLWEASGLPYDQLIEELINLALQRHKEERALSLNL